MTTERRRPAGGRRWLPALAIALGVIMATAPVWRPLLFPVRLTVEEILSFRCGPF